MLSMSCILEYLMLYFKGEIVNKFLRYIKKYFILKDVLNLYFCILLLRFRNKFVKKFISIMFY